MNIDEFKKEEAKREISFWTNMSHVQDLLLMNHYDLYEMGGYTEKELSDCYERLVEDELKIASIEL